MDQRIGWTAYAFATANEDVVARWVKDLDAQAAAFHKTQTASVQQHRHQPRCATEAAKQAPAFFFCRHDRKWLRALGSNDTLNEADLSIQDFVVEKQEGVGCLVLCRGTHTGGRGQAG